MGRRATDHGQAGAFATDAYVVDAEAVAQAILDRIARSDLPRSAMLVSGESLDGRSRGIREDGSPADAGRA